MCADVAKGYPELVTLIDLVSSAKAGSDELDAAIWAVISAGAKDRYRWNGTCPADGPREFTQSMDAARQLVPRPFGSMSVATTFGMGGFGDTRPHSAWAWVSHDCSMAGGPGDPAFEARGRASPALALCEAALLALNGRN